MNDLTNVYHHFSIYPRGTFHNNDGLSNAFSTTWSYSTSDEPERAGAMSDVFVVPNLNVAYETWVTVDWDKDTCQVRQVETGENADGTPIMGLPTRISFDINAQGNKPALSFYSRFQLFDQKIPELEDTVFKLNAKLASAGKVCLQLPDDEDCKRLKAIQDGLDGWNSVLAIETKGLEDKKSIVDWFTSIGKENMSDGTYLFGALDALDTDDQAEQQSSSLVPPSLANDAKSLNSLGRGELEAINRIQFDGGAGQLEMTMSKEKTETWERNTCWKGCAVETELSVG